MKAAYFMAALLLCSCTLIGQTLKRTASLGFQPAAIDSSMLEELKMKTAKGLLVNNIASGGTFEKLAVKKGDVLLRLNGKPTNSMSELLAVRATLRAGDKVEAAVLRAGKSIQLNGKAIGTPKETSEHSEVIYDQFSYKGGLVRTIVNKPLKAGKHPVVFFIPGYTCSSVDNLHPIHPYRKLIDGLVEKGYAVFRMEKPGMGDNQNTGDCQQLGFDNELAAYFEGYKQLARYDFMDQENIFLWGHSMGGIYAPLIAKEYHPKGVVIYGILHDTWTEYLLRMVRYQNPLLGTSDYIQVDQDVRKLYALLYEHYHLGKSSKELYQNPDYKTILERDFGFDGENQIFARHEDFWREIYPHNLSEAWASCKSYVLSMNGEADLQAVNDFSQRELVAIVNHYHPGHGEFVHIPETDHSMIKVGTMAEGASILMTPQYKKLMATQFNYDIVEKTDEWIKDKLRRSIETSTKNSK
ncbi:MAG: alpha/beta fold hydrolase [Bacteroidota bacterium]